MAYRSIPTPDAWYAADSLSQSDNTAVTSVSDLSGNSKTASNNGTVTYRTNQINSLPAFTFTGAGRLQSSQSMGEATTQAFTVFKTTTPTTNVGVVTSSVNGGFELQSRNSSNLGINRKNTNNITASASSTVSANTWYIASGIWVSGSKGTIWQNGTQVANASTALTPVASTLWFGNNAIVTVAEVIIYNTELDTTQRATVHSYLQDKYGITVSDYIPLEVDKVKYHNGTEWVVKPLYHWDGVDYIKERVWAYSGSEWVQVQEREMPIFLLDHSLLDGGHILG